MMVIATKVSLGGKRERAPERGAGDVWKGKDKERQKREREERNGIKERGEVNILVMPPPHSISKLAQTQF